MRIKKHTHTLSENEKNLQDLNASIRTLKHNRLHSTRKIIRSLDPCLRVAYTKMYSPTPVRRSRVPFHASLWYKTDKIMKAESFGSGLELSEVNKNISRSPRTQGYQLHKLKQLDNQEADYLQAILKKYMAESPPYNIVTNNCSHFVKRIVKDFYNVQYYSALRKCYSLKKVYTAQDNTESQKKIENYIQKYNNKIDAILRKDILSDLSFIDVATLNTIFTYCKQYYVVDHFANRDAVAALLGCRPKNTSLIDLNLIHTSLPETLLHLKQRFNDSLVKESLDELLKELEKSDFSLIMNTYVQQPVKQGASAAKREIKKIIMTEFNNIFTKGILRTDAVEISEEECNSNAIV